MWKLASKLRTASLDSSGDGIKTAKEERLECPICWESFNVVENVPYVLWCGHTICKFCLLGLQRAIVNKSSGFPFQLPFFVACPWCSFLSLRLVCNGTIKFPSKNYYLLWMVETVNGSRSDNKRVTSGQRRCNEVTSDDNRGWWSAPTRTGRLHDSVCKSMAIVARLLAKFPLAVIFLYHNHTLCSKSTTQSILPPLTKNRHPSIGWTAIRSGYLCSTASKYSTPRYVEL
ncbi:hypothetical protein Bca52824_084475 [Brassica carinata]|uniref:RING-type domain-containing protein n=1 Tax=Brassica carinata TaxID=52824 RepID=A0A8X7TUL3_BRACI|nr:hypothetical protein Bca52824_084475 [Brassica carinata]